MAQVKYPPTKYYSHASSFVNFLCHLYDTWPSSQGACENLMCKNMKYFLIGNIGNSHGTLRNFLDIAISFFKKLGSEFLVLTWAAMQYSYKVGSNKC